MNRLPAYFLVVNGLMRRDNQMAAVATKDLKVAWPVNATAMYPLLVDISPWSSISDRNHPPDTPQKVHWVGKVQVPVYSFQDVTLREQNLRFGVRGIRAVKEVRNGRCDNLGMV